MRTDINISAFWIHGFFMIWLEVGHEWCAIMALLKVVGLVWQHLQG
jgi:hypothetical protein